MVKTSSDFLYMDRFKTAIYADTSNPHQLSTGLIGGDIPLFPLGALLLTTMLGLLAWALTHKRYRFVPFRMQSMRIRGAVMAVGVAMGAALVQACREELERAGTVANFAPVSNIASHGPFAWTRNGIYLAFLTFQLSLAIGLDTAWLGLSLGMMMVYLDRIVVPAEERFLTTELGPEYLQYCEAVPRWIF